jgi:3-hydroxyacyl-[acyl-carrier-protein] dehydratase
LATVERAFPPDHAAAQGHFPGNPIIPGALLLSEALRAIEGSLGKNLCPYRIRSAKFIRPVRPGERVSIDFAGDDERGIRFTCKVGASTVLAGEIVCDLAPGPD